MWVSLHPKNGLYYGVIRMNKSRRITEMLEGKFAAIKNPNLTRAYGVDTFGELHTKLIQHLPQLMKGATGFFLMQQDSSMPVHLVTKKDGIIGIGAVKGELVPMRAIAIFPMKEMEP